MNFAWWLLTTYPFNRNTEYSLTLFRDVWPSIDDKTTIVKITPEPHDPKFTNLAFDTLTHYTFEQAPYISFVEFPKFRFAFLPKANRLYCYEKA